jgi:hypothetical protein
MSFFYAYQFSSEIHLEGVADDWLSPVLVDSKHV